MKISYRFAVAGNPIKQSLSPEIFSQFFAQYSIDANYIRIAARSADEIFKLAKTLEIDFLNITAPFKNDFTNFVIQFENTLLGVNTLIFKNNDVYAYNTDVVGIKNIISNITNNIFKNKKMNVAILGSGATANSFIRTLQEQFNLSIFARNISMSKQMFSAFSDIQFYKLDELNTNKFDFDIVLCTIPAHGLSNGQYNFTNLKTDYFIDVNYFSDYFKKLADENKINYISGMDLLIEQAKYGFEKFFGFQPENKFYENNKYNLNINRKKTNNIALIGFTGSGKTSIGKKLASKLNYLYFDIDSLIEQKTNLSIKELIREKGIDFFRNLEFEEISQILKIKKRKIISTGGGCVTNLQTRLLLKEKAYNIWLYSDYADCIKRTNIIIKPLLVELDEIGRDYLFEDRKELYYSTADLLVYNDYFNKTIDRLYEEISLPIDNIGNNNYSVIEK